MEIKVFGELTVQKFKTEKKHIVISIQDPNFEFVKLPEQKSRLDYLGLIFYDLDKDTGQFPYDRFLFKESQANSILQFVDKWKDKVDLIVINCVAGVSRSMGVGGALGKILNDDDTYFFKQGIPNMLVYRTILNRYHETKENKS